MLYLVIYVVYMDGDTTFIFYYESLSRGSSLTIPKSQEAYEDNIIAITLWSTSYDLVVWYFASLFIFYNDLDKI